MMNRIIKYLINNPFLAVSALLLLIGWGFVNAPFNWNLNIPRYPVSVDAIPDIGENQQIVFTSWQSRSPKDIEDQITYPLTTELLGIPGVKTIRSSSMFGISSIYIIFKENIDFYWSRSRILEKLNALPNRLLPPGVRPNLGPDATGLGQIYWYTLEGRDSDGNPTGGWDLQELRSIQDYFVKYGLSAVEGVSQVASIGGYVKEYQIDINPDLLKQYNLSLVQVMKAVKETNLDISAKTLEINKVEYWIRGLGYIKSIKDIENTVVASHEFTPILIKDIAKVMLGPKQRRGILDKEGAEAVGGAVIARYGANPMQVIQNIKEKLKELQKGMPSKKLKDGKISQLTVVPFYDRTQLIEETLYTLEEALILEILITILVIIFMVHHLKASVLISGLLPIAILMVFIGMKLVGVEANIVSLSGIAIAIGSMVDISIILIENILKHLKKNPSETPITQTVYEATKEISGAIITAVLTTIISFVPVFTMIGAEGKLFRPLAITKTMALGSCIIITLFVIPALACIIFKKRSLKKNRVLGLQVVLFITGVAGIFYTQAALATILIVFVFVDFLKQKNILKETLAKKIQIAISLMTILGVLSWYWNPLQTHSPITNFLFVVFICLTLLGGFTIFKNYYVSLLKWILNHQLAFLSIPIFVVTLGVFIWRNTSKEFMPSLDEGAFLLMPTSLPHSGVSQNKRILQQLDALVARIPEVQTVVGKAGRIQSALDPAPLSMYENIILYYPEYKMDKRGNLLKFKINQEGLFQTQLGSFIPSGTKVDTEELILDKEDGVYYRNWRDHIKSKDDIWAEIIKASKIPGVTSAPKLQPIETRLVMLQTGMRAPMGIKIKGQNLEDIESLGLQFESLLKKVEGVKKESVFAERIVGKPYLIIDIDRKKLIRYGLTIQQVQDVLEMALSGKVITQTIEGRERYDVRIRYLREKRGDIEALKNIYVPTPNSNHILLRSLVNIRYEKGPQVIKSEDTFLVGYVLFDKTLNYSEVDVVEASQEVIREAIKDKKITIPKGVSYIFTGTYENQLRAQKTLSMVIPLALLIIFVILYLQFKDLIVCLIVFSGIAVAFAGGFIMIGLYGQPWFLDGEFWGVSLRDLFHIKTIHLSVGVWVGFIALFGIATDDGVVMATYLNQVFQKQKPQTREEVHQCVIEAGRKRILPCLMTTVTTILALLPILTSKGKGAGIMIPMAVPCFGGMFMALITLFVVPALFSVYKEKQLKKSVL